MWCCGSISMGLNEYGTIVHKGIINPHYFAGKFEGVETVSCICVRNDERVSVVISGCIDAIVAPGVDYSQVAVCDENGVIVCRLNEVDAIVLKGS